MAKNEKNDKEHDKQTIYNYKDKILPSDVTQHIKGKR